MQARRHGVCDEERAGRRAKSREITALIPSHNVDDIEPVPVDEVLLIGGMTWCDQRYQN